MAQGNNASRYKSTTVSDALSTAASRMYLHIAGSGFLAAAIVFAWYPVYSLALAVNCIIFILLSHRPRDVAYRAQARVLPARREFMHKLQPGSPADDEEECGICMETYTAPCQLPCGHMYCRGCLELVVNSKAQEVRCPQCQRTVVRPREEWETTLLKLRVSATLTHLVFAAIYLGCLIFISLRDRQNVFRMTEVALLSDFSVNTPGLCLFYLPYFAHADRDEFREKFVYQWIRYCEFLPACVILSRRLWSLHVIWKTGYPEPPSDVDWSTLVRWFYPWANQTAIE